MELLDKINVDNLLFLSLAPFVIFSEDPQGWPACISCFHHQQMGIRWSEGERDGGEGGLARLFPMFSLQGVVIKLLILLVPEVSTQLLGSF